MEFLKELWLILAGTSGELDAPPDDAPIGTGDVTGHADLSGTGVAEPTEVSGQSQGQDTEDHFFDPKTLAPELKSQWGRMQTEYNKRMRSIKDLKSKAEVYDRFYSDGQFADQLVRTWAQQHGFTLTPAQQAAMAQAQQQSAAKAQAPQQWVEMAKANLPQELHWMAQDQANMFYALVQEAMAPFKQEQQQTKQQQAQAEIQSRNRAYDELAEELDSVAPNWTDKEEDMTDLLGFLQGSEMRHPKYGSKLSLLYNLVTGNAAAISEATKRINGAVKNRTTVGPVSSSTRPNITDRIRKSNNNDAWELAVQAAQNKV